MTRRRRPPASDRVNQICRELVLSDATRWCQSDNFPRVHVVQPDVYKRMTPDERVRHAEFQAYVDRTYDAALKHGYERLYTRYGGDVADLPWTGTEEDPSG